MEFKSQFIKILIDSITNPKSKNLIIIGSHDDELIRRLAKYFKKVYSCYEFLKIKETKEANLCIKKEPFSHTLNRLRNFDVIVMLNEMHHLPDIQQLQIYSLLKKDQELILMEWTKKGTLEKFYSCFQDCKPLCDLTKQILNNVIKQGSIKIEKKQLLKEEYHFENFNDLRKFFRFILPDHYKFGESLFEKKLKNINFPISLYEEECFYKIKKRLK